jgi:hypothetical protein
LDILYSWFLNFEIQIVDIIRAHPDHEVIISVDTLGKEDLLLHISRALGTKVGASFFLEILLVLLIHTKP